MSEKSPTLTEALSAAGFTHRRVEPRGEVYLPCAHHVLKGDRVVFTGTADSVWTFLSEYNQRIADMPKMFAAARDYLGPRFAGGAA